MLLLFLTSLSLAQEAPPSDSTDPSSNSETDETSSETDDSSSEASTEKTSEEKSEEASTKETNEENSSEGTESTGELKKAVDEAIQNTDKQVFLNTENAESLDTQLTKEQIRWLKPTRGKLPQNPYQHVDFTAYTLEWGEIQLGLNQTSIGILPRTQVGTQVLLNAVGIYNANAKINLLRVGPFDLALTGDYLTLPSDNLQIQYYGIGGYSSLRVLENWSVHAGGGYADLSITGFPSLDGLNSLLVQFAGIESAQMEAISDKLEDSANYHREQTLITANLASDIRLNRRDSFILQGSMVNSQSANSGLTADIEGNEFQIGADAISSPLFQFLLAPQESQTNYTASLAYQASFKRAYVRLGVGYSTVPYSWLLQSVDFTWRLGGKTKRRANNMQKLWELNKKAIKDGGDKK